MTERLLVNLHPLASHPDAVVFGFTEAIAFGNRNSETSRRFRLG